MGGRFNGFVEILSSSKVYHFPDYTMIDVEPDLSSMTVYIDYRRETGERIMGLIIQKDSLSEVDTLMEHVDSCYSNYVKGEHMMAAIAAGDMIHIL